MKNRISHLLIFIVISCGMALGQYYEGNRIVTISKTYLKPVNTVEDGSREERSKLVLENRKKLDFKDKHLISSINNGYSKAISTILDANITTLIAALLLFVFGSGPIKGFSITLSLGVIASMFTAIMLTNLLIHVWFSFSKKKKILL